MISEIAIFEASTPAVDLANPDSQFKPTLQQHLKIVLAFDGAQGAYYGQLIEKPNIIVVVVNWDTLDSHVKATESSDFQAHESSFRSNLVKENTSGIIFHVPFQENMLDALQPRTTTGQIGVTEIVFVYFQPSPLSQTAKDAVRESFKHMEPIIERHGGLTGYRNGWAVEELSVPLTERGDMDGDEGKGGGRDIEGEEDKCTVYVNLTGWDERETHMRFMETEEFKENLHWFMDVEGVAGSEIVHARFWEV
ncbi:MAG: hypothetical protein L6R42_003041 [Xanthoria sp. 1 TBL-2021]|nr:MAG: hypothetical protein L6R42_003041 [Xanthoria sp. 1 TBL-2021]